MGTEKLRWAKPQSLLTCFMVPSPQDKEKHSNFTEDEPGRHHLSQVTKANVTSENNHVLCSLCCGLNRPPSLARTSGYDCHYRRDFLIGD